MQSDPMKQYWIQRSESVFNLTTIVAKKQDRNANKKKYELTY